MKKIVTLFAALFSFAAVLAAPTITSVTAQQRYPWNGKVDISYTVNGDIAAHCKEYGLIPSLKVTATDNAASKTYTATSLSCDTELTAGTHKIVWDMDAQGLSFKSANVVFNVACETIEAQYCVIDLSAGANATSYPVTYLAAEPSGGFNVDTYKTTKLVLKRIAAGSFKMQGVTTTTLTKPFFMGIFEVTQKQWTLVMGSTYFKWALDVNPATDISYNTIRGATEGSKWPISSCVDETSFMGKLQQRTGLNFDLPTEAQWEYACRAGTTTTYYWGDNEDGDYVWNSANSSDQYKKVGTKKPNNWGLYDMLGNAFEWTLDRYNDKLTYGTDPVGPSSSPYNGRVIRGGGYTESWKFQGRYGLTCSTRGYTNPSSTGYGSPTHGFRLSRTLP